SAVEKLRSTELLEIVAKSEPIARKLRALEQAKWPVSFSHVIQPAQAFLVATIARKIDKTIWVFCPSVHSQELLYESLLNWHPNALFLPEVELAPGEIVFPDPEIAAERLPLLMKVERGPARLLFFASPATSDQVAPKRGACQPPLF